jgi:hypothetical protein
MSEGFGIVDPGLTAATSGEHVVVYRLTAGGICGAARSERRRRMRRHVSFMVMLALCAAVPVAGQQVSDSQLFPIVARTAGVGATHWVSDLTLFNPHDYSLTVGLQFFPADQPNAFSPPFPVRITLHPREV